MDKEKTGQLIKEARLKSGLTQTELGDMLGVTNKAVSRWENGESFPDVGVLEALSDALHIRIEDLVTGGEKEDISTTLTDLVNTVKLQKKDRSRWTSVKAVAVLFGLLAIYLGTVIFRGYTSFAEGAAISVLVSVMIFLLIYSAVAAPIKAAKITKSDILWTTVPILTALYSTLITQICFNNAFQGKLTFGLPTEKIGPFLNNQFTAIFVINLSLAVFMIIQAIRNRESVRLSAILSVGALMLELVYSDFLHHISSLDAAVQRFFVKSAQVYLVLIISVLIKIILEKRKKSGAE